MVKADSKVSYGDEKPEKFTEFELLKARVEVMQEVIDEHAETFRENRMKRVKVIDAPYVDDDEIFRRLEDD